MVAYMAWDSQATCNILKKKILMCVREDEVKLKIKAISKLSHLLFGFPRALSWGEMKEPLSPGSTCKPIKALCLHLGG